MKKKERQTTKTSISKAQYYQLEGLLLISAKHVESLREIEAAVIDLTGEKTEVWNGGHSGDAVHGSENAKYLLDKLDLKVRAK